VRRLDNSAIMELKNKYNTNNSSSKKAVLDKLAAYKKYNPKTECILGVANPKFTKKQKSLTTNITHNNFKLKELQGKELFSYVFTFERHDYADEIIKFVQKLLQQNSF
jgi:hypothetical protein